MRLLTVLIATALLGTGCVTLCAPVYSSAWSRANGGCFAVCGSGLACNPNNGLCEKASDVATAASAGSTR